MVLTLAESPYTLSDAGAPNNPYIFLPDFTGKTAGSYVRKDYFDDLTPAEFREFMAYIAPYQPAKVSRGLSENYMLSGWMQDRRQRKEERRAGRQARRDSRTEARNAVKFAKADAISRGEWQPQDWAGIVQGVGGIAREAANFIPGAGQALNVIGGATGRPGAPVTPGIPVAPPEPPTTQTRLAWLDRTNFTGFTNKQTLLAGGVGFGLYKLLTR